ncbi:SH3 domain-containing protein [Halocynthiibacter sp. C4]|uniref:SH3 domain-containing protein n=1 Tax=Halocynthiibacter sp. C4 TaxID=2992758 RepID=UPI00237B1D4E|nr:SH3 domain-containing protein [Halocynthiibacter sp. C4]MDE0591592.1 SH3 domain-containing protein [Halocynthiibacter sp. C4]
MPFSQERTELIQNRLTERLSRDDLNDWERSFLTDMEKRFSLYGARTRLSARQYQKLHSLLSLSDEVQKSLGANALRGPEYKPPKRQLNSTSKTTQNQSSHRSKHYRWPTSPIKSIYAPRRAIRRIERKFVLPIFIVVGAIGLFGGLSDISPNKTTTTLQNHRTQSFKIGNPTLYVTGFAVNQRVGPSTSNQVMGTLSRGTDVKKIGTQGGWTQIQSSLGIGWMTSQYLSTQPPKTGYKSVAANGRLIGAGAVKVIDGDTVTIRGVDANVRLVGFNTPEVGSAACNQEYVQGQRATARLNEIVRSGQRIEFQRVACACRPGTEGTKACNYGRECGILYVDGKDVGKTLISEGLAVRYICGRTSCPPRPGNWCQ